jgi:hypothetical protein
MNRRYRLERAAAGEHHPVTQQSLHRPGTCSTQAIAAPVGRVRKVRSMTPIVDRWRSISRSNDGQTILDVALRLRSKALTCTFWSGWPDSNRRPPAPKQAALVEAVALAGAAAIAGK